MRATDKRITRSGGRIFPKNRIPLLGIGKHLVIDNKSPYISGNELLTKLFGFRSNVFDMEKSEAAANGETDKAE